MVKLMQKVFCFVVMALLMVSCHDSLDDRAEKEAKNYTERYCPTPVQQNQRTDSLTFDRHTHTYNYYYTLTGPADNADVIGENRQKLKDVLVAGVRNDTRMKAYKDAGFGFHFVYLSESTGKVLLEVSVTSKDY